MPDSSDGPVLKPPPPIRIPKNAEASDLPNEVEMPLVDHLEELRQSASQPAGRGDCSGSVPCGGETSGEAARSTGQWNSFPSAGTGEFLFVSFKVAGYGGLTLALPYVLFQLLAFVLPGLTVSERRLIAPAVAGSAVLFLAGLAFAWWALVPAALRFLVTYGADVVEPLWSIERYLDFVLLLMLATGLAFQLPVLQLLLGVLGLVRWRTMLSAWRWVVLGAALAGAVLTPSTDPITMLLLAGAITALFLIGVGLVALTETVVRPETP